MAWDRSVTEARPMVAAPSDIKVVTDMPFHRKSRSLAYSYYRFSYSIGRYTIKVATKIGDAAQEVWRHSFADIFDRLWGLSRYIVELKRSRVIRGEVSISRGLFSAGNRSIEVFNLVAGTLSSKGLISGAKFLCKRLGVTFKEFAARNRRAFNYLAPVAGAAVLGLTILYWSGFTMAISVSYNGKNLGAVSSERVYNEAATSVQDKVTEASGTDFVLGQTPVFAATLARKSTLLNATEMSDNILGASDNNVASGYGLYVNNVLVGAYSDSAELQSMLDSILAPYKANTSYGKVAFYQTVEIKKGAFPTSITKAPEELKAVLTTSAENQRSYVAQKGDSIPMVANMFHIPAEKLYDMNHLTASDTVKQGQTLQVGNSESKLQVKYTIRQTSTQSVPFQTISTQSDKVAQGMTKVTQKGQAGVMQLTSDVSYVGDTVVASEVITTEVTKAPVNQTQVVGTFDISQKAATIIDYSERFLGARYVPGGASTSGFDCSGFTMYVFSKYGIYLPHSAAGQASYGYKVNRNELLPGDLVFFNTTGGISHVGIYIGNNQFINAENSRSGVTITSLNTAYWSRCYVTARRVIG